MISLLSILWLLTSFDGDYYHQVESGNVITLQSKPQFVIMLTQPCGDSVAVTMQVDGEAPQFTYRGEGTWNTGCRLNTNFVRLYFTSSTNLYSNITSRNDPNSYWWSTSYLYIDPARWTLGYPVTLPAEFYPWEWTNGVGELGTVNPAAFATCVNNRQRCGLSFGGRCYGDAGIALNGGTATITVSEP